MFSTYNKNDVTILLKDISGLVTPIATAERERLIQSGIHYSEMLPQEYEPSEKYLELFYESLRLFSNKTAQSVASVARKIWEKHNGKVVIVSLARAGTPIGILIKRYIERKYKVKIQHYTISIIRGKGIDKNAMSYILSKHTASDIQFVDGWIGKGAIQNQLCEALKEYNGVSNEVAVLSDPANITSLFGTREDFLIPSSCLNSTVSGLLSRTFFRKDIIGEKDYHGAAFYSELADKDLTYYFINSIEKEYEKGINEQEFDDWTCDKKGIEEVFDISQKFNIKDINFIKPGIGETIRVLLRRVPWKILVSNKNDEDSLKLIYQLALEKNVQIEKYDLKNYKACGLIKDLSDI